MRLYRPKSFLSLVLLGFGFVSLPLIAALVSAGISMGWLAGQSSQAVYRSVGVVQGSRILMENLIALERKVRQYDVLGDKHLFEEAAARHEEIERNFQQLMALPLAEGSEKRLESLSRKESELFAILQDSSRGGDAWNNALRSFGNLHSGAQKVYEESNQLVVHEVDAMQKRAQQSQEALLWQAVALVPFTILFVVIFTHLISRPIQQIDKVIYRLGEGDFSSPAKVSGPRDLEFLGQRLDWLRTRLSELERMKSKFVAQISHELKTPLASIREGAELLADGVVGPLNNQQQEISGILCKNSIQLQHLIENLLGISKSQAKISPLHLSAVDMPCLIDEVLDDHKAVILKKKLVLDRAFESATLRGDRERLKTVFDNLVSNAVKYTPEKGRIALALQCGNGFVEFNITDSGPGVSAEERDKVFEPFYQGRSPITGHIKGTGLGLSIAREFVLAHGGEICLVDNAAGGAHFKVSLPLDAKEASA